MVRDGRLIIQLVPADAASRLGTSLWFCKQGGSCGTSYEDLGTGNTLFMASNNLAVGDSIRIDVISYRESPAPYTLRIDWEE
jgi:hypothetical protein